MRSIAERAGLTKGSFYHHFDSKQSLLHEIHDVFIDAYNARVQEILASDAPTDEQLRRVIRDVIVEGSRQFKSQITIFFGERNRLEPERYAAIKAKRDEFERGVVEIVTRGVADGTLEDRGDPRLIAFALIGMSAWTYHWLDPSRGSALPIGDLFSDIFLDGMRRQPA